MCVQTSRFAISVVSNSTNTSNFHPVKVVGRGSETQLQVGEKLNYLFSALRVNAMYINFMFVIL